MVIKDPVEVYCRIRPVSVADEGYITVMDPRTLQLATPDSSIGTKGTYKETQYTFSVCCVLLLSYFPHDFYFSMYLVPRVTKRMSTLRSQCRWWKTC